MSYRVEKVGERIYLKSNRPTPGLKRAIPGASWLNTKQCWSLPLNMETCLLLRERFGRDLEIGPQLRNWAVVEKTRRAALSDTASQLDADLLLVPERAPRIAKAMGSRKYQRVAARYITDAMGRDGIRRALLADTVGLGKTVEALASVVEADVAGPYLVVAPKTAVETVWRPEIEQWMPGHEVVTVPEGRAARDAILTEFWVQQSEPEMAATWLVIHPAAVRTKSWFICGVCGSETPWSNKPVVELDCGHDPKTRKIRHDHEFPQLFGINWGAIIVDESDQCLSSTTITQMRRGMDLLRDNVRPNGLRLAMSGTPFRSRPHLLWGTLNWLDPKAYSGKWRWIEMYWRLGGYSGYEIGKFIEEREQMLLDELKPIMLRRTREEVRSDLPAKLYGGTFLDPGDETSPHGVWLPMEPAQEKAYRQMEETARADLAEGEVSAVGVLAELTRLKQFASGYGTLNAQREFVPARPSNKYNWTLELLRTMGFPDDPETKVIIASQFTQTLNAWREWLLKDLKKPEHQLLAMITGEVSQVRRTAAVEAFERLDSGPGIMLLNTKAGGSSITLDAATVTIFIDETWVADDQEQVEGRSDNRNPERRILPRTYYYLRSLGTIEESIARSNAEAQRLGKRVLDGNRISASQATALLGRS